MDEQTGKIIREVFIQQSQREKAEKLERYRRLNRFVRKGQILFCGSSLMEQFPIQELLLDRGSPLVVYNRGVGGFTTTEMEAVLETVVFDLMPRAIFINIGTNDLNDPACTIDLLIARYDAILSMIQARLPDAKLFLLAYYPVNTAVGSRSPYMAELLKVRTNTRIREANAAVAELAKKYFASFLDLNDAITDENGEMDAAYCIEGMHMYGDGYARVLERLLPVLESIG